MANGADQAFGFLADKLASEMAAPLMECFVASGNSNAIGRGDAVTPSNDGTVTRAAAGDVILGVADGVKYLDANNLRTWEPFIAASKAGFVNVHWHPYQVYRVQGDVTALVQTAVFNTVNHTDPGDTSATYNGISRQYIVGPTATTNTLGWKVFSYPRATGGTNSQGGNSSKIGDTYPIYQVISNRRFLGNQIAGV